MIWQLLRRQPYVWIVPVGAAVVVGLGYANPGAVIAPLVVVSLMGHGRPLGSRGTAFELTLPIASRDLYLSRALIFQAMLWFPCLAWWARQDNPLAPHGLVIAAGASFGIQVSLSLRPELAAIPLAWAALALVLSFGVGAGLSLTPNPEWVVAVVLAATVFLFFRTWLTMPPSFQLAPREPTNEARAWRIMPGLRGSWTPTMRSFPWSIALLMFPALAMMGIFGAPPAVSAFPLFMFTLVASERTRAKTRWMTGLPFSPRFFLGRVLLVVVVPTMLVFGIGLALPSGIGSREVAFRASKVPQQSSAALDIQAPFEFWHRAPGGTPPQIVAPWGETAAATVLNVLGVTFYNPYSLSATNSREFHDWQFARATQAVVGRAFTPREFAEASPEAKVGVLASRRSRLVESFFLLWFQTAVLCTVELGGSRWLSRAGPKVRQRVIGAPFTAFLVVWAGSAAYRPLSGLDIDPLNTIFQACLLHAVSLPWSTWGLAALGLLPLIGMLAVLDWQFRNSEAFGLRTAARVVWK